MPPSLELKKKPLYSGHLPLYHPLKKRPFLFQIQEEKNPQQISTPLPGIPKQLKDCGVSMEVGQPYFIKRLDMCNPAFLCSEEEGEKRGEKVSQQGRPHPLQKEAARDRMYVHTA